LATGAINTVVTRVVGTGLAMQPAIDINVLGITREQAEQWQNTTKRRWAMWAERNWCDASRRQNFYGLQSLAWRSTLEGGDCFALQALIEDPRAPSLLAIKLIEAERCVNPRGQTDTARMCAGVEMNDDGAAQRYHFLRDYTGAIYAQGMNTDGDWIDAVGAQSGRRNVLHIMDPRRIGQTRGMPYLAPVIEAFGQLGRYTDAEIAAAVLNAFFAVAVEHPSGQGLSPLESAMSGTTGTAGEATGQSWDGTLTNGLAVDIAPGSSIKSIDPGRPNVNFDPFVQAILRQIGVALELPFEVLVKHFTSSFTAARAALLDLWLFVRKSRDLLEAQFCQPIYDEWLRLEVATGRIAAPGFFSDDLVRHAWCNAQWTGDAMGVLNPLQEISASEKAIELKLTSREREAMQRDGSSWQDTIEQLGREEQAIEAAGLAPKAPPVVAAPPAPAVDNADDAQQRTQNENDDDAET
jgi:lambda family phage portal protein